MPAIVDAYGKDAFHFSENNIRVTIPFDRLETRLNDPVGAENAPVDGITTPVEGKNTPVTTPVGDKNTPAIAREREGTVPASRTVEVTERILAFCIEPRGIMDIAVYLGYKEKKTVRKYLVPLLEQGKIAMTVPDKPNSRFQKYITIR